MAFFLLGGFRLLFRRPISFAIGQNYTYSSQVMSPKTPKVSSVYIALWFKQLFSTVHSMTVFTSIHGGTDGSIIEIMVEGITWPWSDSCWQRSRALFIFVQHLTNNLDKIIFKRCDERESIMVYTLVYNWTVSLSKAAVDLDAFSAFQYFYSYFISNER